MTNHILSNQENGVLTITLNRLDKKNALSSAMYARLIELFENANNDSSINCILLQGDQTCFSAGNDLKDFMANTDELIAITFTEVIAAFEKPIIAAVAGAAVGIGTTMLLHCDMVIAADNTKFKLPFTQLALCPEAGSSYILAQRVGYNRAFELLVLGDLFTPEKALEYGIINQITTPDAVLAIASEIAHKISALPSDSVLTSRRLIRQANQQLLESSMDEEIKEFKRLIKSEDCKAILAKFFA